MITGRIRWRRLAAVLGLGLAVLLSAPEPAPAQEAPESLRGRFLVAEPELRDANFFHTIIYMVRHDAGGAMGIVINRSVGRWPVAEVMRNLGIDAGDNREIVRVHYGGPVEPEAAFVIHSTDYIQDGTVEVSEAVSMTSRHEIFEAIARGEGPRDRLLAFGFSGWGPGQLERELDQGGWFVLPGDAEFLFDPAIDSKWDRALARRTIDL